MSIMEDGGQLIRAMLFVCTGCTICCNAGAGEADWHISGFGTIAGAMTDEDVAEYRTEQTQSKGATSDVDWGLHSVLGMKLSVDLGEQWSLTTQAVARRNGSDDLVPNLDWLYLSYHPRSWFDLRAGRFIMPAFLLSDYLEVGYAQPTIGPPAHVYIQGSISTFEGLQLFNRFPVGTGSLSIQTSAGSSEADIYVQSPDFKLVFDINNLASINANYEWNNWLLRAGFLQADFSPDPLYTLETKFTSLGVQYDNGKLLFIAERITRESEPITDSVTAQYILAGWHFGKWLPSITYSEANVEYIWLVNVQADSEATALTLRYDLSRSTAIKLQWEQVPPTADALWLNPYPAFLAGKDREIVSFGLDFVF